MPALRGGNAARVTSIALVLGFACVPLGASGTSATAGPSAPAASASPAPAATPAATSSSVDPAPPAHRRSRRRPLIAAPRGFRYVRRGDAARGLHVRGEWVTRRASHQHAVFVGTIQNDDFSALGTNVDAFMPPMIRGIRRSAKGFILLTSERLRICDGRSGYLVRYLDHRGRAEDVSIVFGLSHDTIYAAFYQRDAGSPALAAGVRAIESLCPPPAGAN